MLIDDKWGQKVGNIFHNYSNVHLQRKLSLTRFWNINCLENHGFMERGVWSFECIC